jgi:hypothetical protein
MPPVLEARIPLIWAIWAWLKRDAHDKLTTTLLALAALATSWSSYQASIWGGVQSSSYSRSGGMRARATHAADDAQRLRIVDIAMFMNWMQAYGDGHETIRRYYETHFRPEFRPAFKAWIATASVTDTDGTTPFQRPEYRLAKDEEASQLDREATRLFQQGQEANDNSDRYVFNTVILAAVLFFTGSLQTIRSNQYRGIILTIACLMFIVALVRIMTSPVAR